MDVGRGDRQVEARAPVRVGDVHAECLHDADNLEPRVRLAPRRGGHSDPAAQRIASAEDVGDELLVGYGESRIASRNIPLRGGTVQVHGTAIPEGHGVWMAGYEVPVDDKGSFVAEEILPEGMHTVEVAVLDKFGNGELFLRDLKLKKSDWFTVGIADLTLSGYKTDGPAELLAPDKPQYSDNMDVQGRLAFYTKGKFGNG